jgi:hypothetical protein
MCVTTVSFLCHCGFRSIPRQVAKLLFIVRSVLGTYLQQKLFWSSIPI